MKSSAWAENWRGKASAVAGMLMLLAVGVTAGVPGTSEAREHWGGHGHVSIEVAPPWWGPWGAYWYPLPYGYYDPWYNRYPSAVVEEPRVYVEPPQIPAPPNEGYWYYCPSARGYYPTVQTCPEAWVKVPPRPE